MLFKLRKITDRQDAKRQLIAGLIIGGCEGVIIGVILELFNHGKSLREHIISAFIFSICFGLITGLIGGLIYLVRKSQASRKA